MKTSVFRRGAAAILLMALASCASQPDIAADAGVGDRPGAGGAVDPASPEYLRVAIGDTVYFTTDSSDLTPTARAVLDQQAEWLRAHPNVVVRLEGHADERGTREYNIALGVRRASAVSAYLATRGVPSEQLSIGSYGRERPIASCPSEDCWARNRRVQTVPQ